MKIQWQQKTATHTAFDAVIEWIDSSGDVWNIGIETKSIQGRVDVHAISISAAKPGYPLKRRVLRELPLNQLVKDVIAAEEVNLKRFKKHQTELEPHHGRAHRDDELKLIAEIYMSAYNSRLPVQRTVAETLDISPSTAIKRIMEARKRGFIPADTNEKRNP